MKLLRRYYEHDYAALETEVKADPLTFRRKARQAFEGFDRKQRRTIGRLTTPMTHALQFFTVWESLRGDFATMERAHTVKSFVNSLEKQLVLPSGEGEALARQLAITQRQDRISKALDGLYHPGDRVAQRTARKVFSLTDDAILTLRDSFVTYSLYRAVADAESMTIYDVHRALGVRLIQSMRQAAQIRRFIRKTRRSLEKIHQRIRALEVQDDGLLASLFALNVSLVSIRAAHGRYEKKVDNFKEDSKNQASRRLAVYEKEVADIKAQYLEGLPSSGKLRDIQQATKELDGVLLRIFDMDSRSYNELMSRMKHYREQVRHREVLVRQLHDNK